MNNKLVLYCCINVFNISPTFMLPVFKDIVNNDYYAQCSNDNIIVGFEKIEIDQYLSMSKIYYLDTINYYSIGSNTIYSLDYHKGYIYGSCAQIISFYRNNLSLFDDCFAQYMSDFITKNNMVILNNKGFQMEIYRNKVHNNSGDPPIQSLITRTNKSKTIIEKKRKNYRQKQYDLFLNNGYSINNYLIHRMNNPIETIKIFDYQTYYLSSKRLRSLNNTEQKMFNALFSPPPVVNLWSDTIVKAFVDINHFYDSLSFDKHFPGTMFINYLEWQHDDLPIEVEKKTDMGYSVQYLNIIPFSERMQLYIIVAQEYYSGENRFRLFNGNIKTRDFIKFNQDLSNDMNNEICYIINPDCFFKHIINIERIASMLENKTFDFIFPPQSCSVPII